MSNGKGVMGGGDLDLVFRGLPSWDRCICNTDSNPLDETSVSSRLGFQAIDPFLKKKNRNHKIPEVRQRRKL